ncbi:hypothetical protein [Nostoc sp. FACHB-280]|nr:hypothetical protein [Nostoc sp. FACHB-280]MBD2494259.1 hypothetical protein [Nostoc sp. FACHB-280]
MIRVQDPITLPSHSEPEADVAIVYGNETDYLPHHFLPVGMWDILF